MKTAEQEGETAIRHFEKWFSERFPNIRYREKFATDSKEAFIAGRDSVSKETKGQVMCIGMTETPEERAAKFEREATFYRKQSDALKTEIIGTLKGILIINDNHAVKMRLETCIKELTTK